MPTSYQYVAIDVDRVGQIPNDPGAISADGYEITPDGGGFPLSFGDPVLVGGSPSGLTYAGEFESADGVTGVILAGIAYTADVPPVEIPFHLLYSNQPVGLGTSYTQDSAATLNCFAAGTRIATPRGETAIEDLATGDLVTTADGRAVAVRWVARQSVATRFAAASGALPVRVAAHAFGPGLPHADLVLTADHALIVGGFAINAGALINGTSVRTLEAAELPDRQTYYHLETDRHETLLANGLPSESFIDYATRRGFDNYHEYAALYGGEDTVIAEMPLPRISAARLVPACLRDRLLARPLAA